MNEHRSHRLVLAVQYDDFATVKALLRDPTVDVDFCIPDYGTALHAAIERANVHMVRTLLKHGATAEPSDLPRNLLSPIWSATLRKHYEISCVLIEAGANVNRPYNDDCRAPVDLEATTLLHAAALAKNDKLLRRLLEAGADANACNRKGESPLQTAIDAGCSHEFARILLDHGASATYSTKAGRSVLHYAIRAGSSAVTGLLMDHDADPFDVHCSGKTSLFFAADAKVENTRIAEMLIDEGIEVDAADRITLNTPLHMAVMTGKQKMAELLLDYGADVGARNRAGYSALGLAVQDGTAEMVQIMLAHGADPNETLLLIYTMLHLACTAGCERKIQLLLDHGADMNRVDGVGRTPLQMIKDFQSRAALVMVKHFIYLSQEDPGLVSEADRRMLMDNESLKQIYAGCFHEIGKLKTVKVYDGITYEDLLIKNDEQLAKLLENEDLAENLDWLDHDWLFPLYAYEIGAKFDRARKIRDSRRIVEHFLIEVFGSRLPSLVIYKLVSYLEPDDLCLD